MVRARPRLSLKARAIRWLAQREHSRAELRRKLSRALDDERRRAAQLAADRAPGGDGMSDGAHEAAARRHPGDSDAASSAGATADSADEIDALLDRLEAQGLLSDARFVESRIRLRQGRHGVERIRQELARHGAQLDAEQQQALRSTELSRARAIWQRRFGRPAQTPAERARQARFLASRGFPGDVIRRVVSSPGLEDDD